MKIIGWYFSFAGTDKFLGCCQTHGEKLDEAFLTVNRLGLNPGGQVAALPITDDMHSTPEMWNKLYTTLDEMNAVYGKVIKQKDLNEKQAAAIAANSLIMEEEDNKVRYH